MAEPEDDRSTSDDCDRAVGEFEAAWRERFEKFAVDRDDDAGIAGWTASGLDIRLRKFVGIWQPGAPGELWLDAGCGAGTYSRLLHRHGAVTVGLDYSIPTLQKARRRCPDAILFAIADVRQLPFSSNRFDGALCFGVMQALDESHPALRELASVIRPGGMLWIDALNRGCVVHRLNLAYRTVRRRQRHLRYEWPNAIRATLVAEGFKDVRIHWVPIVPARWPAVQRWAESELVQRLLKWIPGAGLLLSHSFLVSAVKPVSGNGRAQTDTADA